MAKTVIVHIIGEDPVVGEIDQAPQPNDNFIVVSNARRRDGKDVSYLAPGCEAVLYPWSRVTFVEYMVSEDDRGDVIDFFRLE
jgi:hypothetical protein